MTAVEPKPMNGAHKKARSGRNVPNARLTPEQWTKMSTATDLWVAGMTFRQIAVAVGVSLGTAHNYVDRGQRQLLRENGVEAEAKRTLARMDRAANTAMVIMVDSDRTPMERLAAIDRLVRVEARRASLLGLDAPKNYNVRADVRVVAVETLEAEITATKALIAAGSLVLDANSSVTVESLVVDVEGFDEMGDEPEDDVE